MSKTLASPLCDSAPSNTDHTEVVANQVSNQQRPTLGQAPITPPRYTRLHAFLCGVVGLYLLASFSLVLLVVDLESPTFLTLAILLVSAGGIGAVGTRLVGQSKRQAWWAVWGVLIGLGLSLLFACIGPYYF